MHNHIILIYANHVGHWHTVIFYGNAGSRVSQPASVVHWQRRLSDKIGPSWTHSLAPVDPSVSLRRSFLFATKFFCLKRYFFFFMVIHPGQHASISLTVVGRVSKPLKTHNSFFSSADGQTTEPSDAGEEPSSLGLLMAGCVRSPTVVCWQQKWSPDSWSHTDPQPSSR
jgi:hypothetical protein